VNRLEATFPGLARGSYAITSPRTRRYNCIAWAAGDVSRWWWPGHPDDEYWPASLPREETLDAFREAFASLGYAACPGEEFEPGFEKVALFAAATGEPTHAARQLPGGRWSSKLGTLEDIEHALHDLKGMEYGTVVLILKRPVVPVAVPDREHHQDDDTSGSAADR
jgi:hypothetical protein